MDEISICSKLGDVGVFQRRIEFHPARQPFLGFISNNSPDFQLETLNPTSSSDYTHRSTLPLINSSKKSDAGREHGIDAELCFGITVRRIGAGLENLGNTCFLNSVLQCLTYTEPFAAYLQSGKHKSSCHTAGFCAMCALQNHVKRALQSTGRILAPKDLVMNLRCISRNFRNARQEDAHEYMVNLLESMHKCCLPSGVPSESPSAYEKSLVHKIFGGRLRSQVKCMQCSYCSNTFDPFLDLSLEIMKADSLRKALSHFTAVEQLDGGERQYQCQRCKQKVKALKQLTVHKAPYVLSIHLKRFGSHVHGQKIDKKVEFGPTLDLKPFVSGSYEGDLKYTLYGVLVHAGWSTHSGHYYCFVRTSSGMWHSLDDNRVVQVSEKTVLQQKAYMLFYVRDTQNFAPRKPVDRKENGVPSIIDNRELCASEAVQNGPLSTGLRTLDLSKPQLKESSIVKFTTGLDMEEAMPLKVPMSQSSSMTLVKGWAVKQPINGPSVEDVRLKSISSSVEGNNSNSYPPVATSGTKTDRECLRQGSNPVAAPSCSGSQSSGPKKHAVNEVTHVSDIVANKEMLSGGPQKKVNNLKFEESISARLSNKPGHESNQNEGGRVSGELSCQRLEYDSLTSMETKLVEPSTKVCKMTKSVQKKAPGHHHNLQKGLMPKRKVIKARIASMHLGSRFLMKASLSLYKKRKQKRNKRQSLELKSHIEEKFGEDSTSGALEPSTSEKVRITDLVSTHAKRRQRKFSAEKGSGQRATKDVETFKKESVINVPEGDLRDRIYQNNSVLASNEPPRKCSSATSESKQLDPREPDTAQVKKGLFENGLMSMLTRGLEDTVAGWDEIESSPSQHLRSTDGKSITIGYVPDEWDEEYDRGKRKKVRNPKDSFDNSNPFQEIATKKAKLGTTKVDRTRSGNQPLRIR